MYKHWLYEKEDHLLTITLNRPDKKNRLDGTTFKELAAITKAIKEDPSIWVIVIKANGENFSAGVDVSVIGDLVGNDHDTFSEKLMASQKVLDDFEAIEKPVIACMHGHVVGGGLILSLCCDFRIAADNTIISLPEVKRSIGVIMGTQRITKTVGVAHTKELVMIGDPIDAETGNKMGFFHRLVGLDQLDKEVDAWVNKLLKLPPLAVGLCKQIINEGQYLSRNGQDLEIGAQSKLLKSKDFQESISAFFEKRVPKYSGS